MRNRSRFQADQPVVFLLTLRCDGMECVWRNGMSVSEYYCLSCQWWTLIVTSRNLTVERSQEREPCKVSICQQTAIYRATTMRTFKIHFFIRAVKKQKIVIFGAFWITWINPKLGVFCRAFRFTLFFKEMIFLHLIPWLIPQPKTQSENRNINSKFTLISVAMWRLIFFICTDEVSGMGNIRTDHTHWRHTVMSPKLPGRGWGRANLNDT